MAKNRYDIIAVGEAGLDGFVLLNEASLLCTIKKDNCLLCLKYADKIPIDEFHELLGHNACNVAVGSARLGLKSALYCVIGDDDIAEKIKKKLACEGVSTEYIACQKNSKSNYSVVLNYKAERTILVYHVPRTYHFPSLSKTSWVYLTSLGKGFRRVHAHVLSQKAKNGFSLAFNPGDQQLRAGLSALKSTLKATDVLIVNKQEAEMLLSAPATPIEDLLVALAKLGPNVVIITDGSRGAFGYDRIKVYRAMPMPARPIEMTGAGDSFSTGVLCALSYGLPLDVALQWGSANAASVIEHIGPQAGLLTRSAVEKRIVRKKKK